METLATLDAANVLIAAPAADEAAREACARLRSGGGPADRSLVGVTSTRTPDEWLAARAGQLPPKVWLVCAGEEARSAAARRTGPHTPTPTSPSGPSRARATSRGSAPP